MKISQSILAKVLISTSLALFLSACPPTEGPSKRLGLGDGVGHEQPQIDPQEQREAKTTFEAKGISVPDTTMTAADNTRAAKLDLARIREAIAQAKILSEKEVEDIEKKASGKKDEVRPTNVRARDDDDHAENEAIESPPPSPKAMAAPAVAMEMAANKSAPAKMDGVLMAKKMKMKDTEKSPEKPQKTVLKQITSQAREAKVLVRNEEGKLVPLLARETRLVTYIQGPRARTVVDTVFENMTEHQLQGTFYFPLPADSSPVGFAMFSGAIPAETAKAFSQGKSLPKLPDNSFLAANMDAYAPSRDG
ncbi:MAG: hypothetical protein JRF33_14445, partial [Deltaproteobacteria bacterium]|nr:hypothetical protein [Deltaproteobacteria bacterium]